MWPDVILRRTGAKKKKKKGGSQLVAGSFAALLPEDSEEGCRDGAGEAPDLEDAADEEEGIVSAAAAEPEPAFAGMRPSQAQQPKLHHGFYLSLAHSGGRKKKKKTGGSQLVAGTVAALGDLEREGIREGSGEAAGLEHAAGEAEDSGAAAAPPEPEPAFGGRHVLSTSPRSC